VSRAGQNSGRRKWLWSAAGLVIVATTVSAIGVHQSQAKAAPVQFSRDSAERVATQRAADSTRRADSVRAAARTADSIRADVARQQEAEAETEQSIRELMAPQITRVTDSLYTIRAGTFAAIPVARTDGRRTCTLDARLRGVAGGKRDFEPMLFEEAAFANWNPRASRTAAPLWKHPRTADDSMSIVLPHVGNYELVVSNAFGFISEKAVAVNASVRCVASTH